MGVFNKKENFSDRLRKSLGMNSRLQNLEQEIEDCQKYLTFVTEIDSFIKTGSKLAFDYEIYNISLSKLNSASDLSKAKSLILSKLNSYIIFALKNDKDPIYNSLQYLENFRKDHSHYESYKKLQEIKNYDDLDNNKKIILLEIAKIQASPNYLNSKKR